MFQVLWKESLVIVVNPCQYRTYVNRAGPAQMGIAMIGGGGGNRTLVLTSSHMGLS